MLTKLIEVLIFTKNGNEFKVKLPHTREVCDRCGGEGKHDPQAFAQGFLPSEFNDDPEFAAGYFKGDYDVTCEKCNGQKVVWEIDFENCSKKYQARLEYMWRQKELADSEDYYERRAFGF